MTTMTTMMTTTTTTTTMAVLLGLVLLFGPRPARDKRSIEERLKDADFLAAQARQERGAAKDAACSRALEAFAEILRLKPKDYRLAARVRRRRASLLRSAGRMREALAEQDAIVEGKARRKDRARALYDGALLLRALGDAAGTERRLNQVLERYRDIQPIRAKTLMERGDLMMERGRPDYARAAWREVVDKCPDEEKQAIAAFDRLALQAVDEGDTRRARRWLQRCVETYGKRAARGDRTGAFLSRQLGAMRAPARLAEATARKKSGGDAPRDRATRDRATRDRAARDKTSRDKATRDKAPGDSAPKSHTPGGGP